MRGAAPPPKLAANAPATCIASRPCSATAPDSTSPPSSTTRTAESTAAATATACPTSRSAIRTAASLPSMSAASRPGRESNDPMTDAQHIAATLGGRRARHLPDGSYLTCCPMPNHGKGRGDHDPSLRVSNGQTRLLVHCYAGCDRLHILDELRRRGLLIDNQPRRRSHLHFEEPWIKKHAADQHA